ncbi:MULTISPECIES: P1 family peptidase [unclassified Streptomyces]|uniref:P1 family peptidase n=1 Tax=unclassified Streptomyces TaxID=2593676 RepID=UPI002DD8B052|nr:MULTISPECIES: P1 family peptidase [unclassified Streptomyces]WSA94170.1 P1 family peptidase [Streptomyces sp. NBC_01795]WSB78589.1 P1 family peptidase [Streptomyces sp. NBC_01775]WSS13218.1 P1 family peptidase [Streptomyces sp. NBC_01186]WSS42005.1 P1 family peptidase [Streptomyces sp. NBC_01187]
MDTHDAQGTRAPRDALTDVPGLRVGHAQRTDDGWLTGTTVVLTPENGAVAGVDARGGAPGTRETDALDPKNIVERIHAVVLSGGSAFGLDAASGVMAWLEEQSRGVRVGPDPSQVVPVVPAAVIFDLGRGGRWKARPDASLGRKAVEEAAATAPGAPVAEGCVGAGTGAVVGGLKGGIGTASTTLPSGAVVGVLVALNAAGSATDPATGALYGELTGGVPRIPTEDEHAEAEMLLAEAREETGRRTAGSLRPTLNTTLAVVATDASLTRPQAQRLAGSAHDGLARAVRPIHLMHDGDAVFALSTGERQPVEGEFNDVLAAGADVVTRAVVKAVRAAEGVDGPGGVFPSYRDLYGEVPPDPYAEDFPEDGPAD